MVWVIQLFYPYLPLACMMHVRSALVWPDYLPPLEAGRHSIEGIELGNTQYLSRSNHKLQITGQRY